MQTQERWAAELGLARSPLFGGDMDRVAHSAMLDGVAGSFVLSDAAAETGFDRAVYEHGADWSWSSMMRNHVLVEGEKVIVAQADSRKTQSISLSSVEADLGQFLTYLEQTSSSSEDVVDHVVGCFQSLRAELPGESSDQLTIFLSLLALVLENPHVHRDELPDQIGLLGEFAARYDLDSRTHANVDLTSDLTRRFYQHLLSDARTGRQLEVGLTVRHAGSELFQAAQLVPAPPTRQGQFFGMLPVRISVRPHSLKGVAYTPIGLARSLAEQAIAHRIKSDDKELIVADYACGSGSFLTEAIAALGRSSWRGRVKLVGYDTSETAIIATKFAVAFARRDHPELAITSSVLRQDFLAPDFEPEAADIVLMNPPYAAWADMDVPTRERLKATLGAAYRNRPDLSMAFVQRALEAAKPDAVVATLLPAGVIAGESARSWRHAIADQAAPRLVAVLGDHSLFRFATVNVAAVVLEKGAHQDRRNDRDVSMIWASEASGAASAALRELRRPARTGQVKPGGVDSTWSIYQLDRDEMTRRVNWLPSPMLLPPGAAERLREMTRIQDLFDVRTGIRAGDRRSLILSRDAWLELSREERKGFQPVAEKQMISGGKVQSTAYYFAAGSEIETEEELQARYPTYFERHLLPAKATLEQRKRTGPRWWLPSESRNTWRRKDEPRIVSRQWFKNDGFAVDATGKYAVVQGYAWFPKPKLRAEIDRNKGSGTILEILHLYCVVFSSDVFFKVAREYSTNAAGGQINLQQNLIRNIPVPVLPELLNIVPGLLLQRHGWDQDFPDLEKRNQFAARCYGFDPGLI